MRIRERPKCRNVILRLISAEGFTLEQIASGAVPGVMSFSDGLRLQARKMLDERAYDDRGTPLTVYGKSRGAK